MIEQTLDRAATVLKASVTAVAGRVYRGRVDALSDSELPALVLARIATDHDAPGDHSLGTVLQLDLHCLAGGANWETLADDLSVAADTALQSDEILAGLCRGLRLVHTAADAAPGQRGPVGRLILRYQAKYITRRGQLTAAQT